MLIENDPGRLRSLVLIDAGAFREYLPAHMKIFSIPIIGAAAIYLTPPKWAVKLILKSSYYDAGKITKEQIAAPGGKHALLETGKQIVPPNIDELTAKYKDINVPTLIIWGTQDKVINPIVGTLLDQAIPNSTLKWIDRCGHVPQEERPEATVPLVLDFLAGL